jgi:hypothetical protein
MRDSMTDDRQTANATPEGTGESPCRSVTLADLDRVLEEHERKMDAAFEHDAELGYITIKIAYPYHIALSRISSKEALLGWVYHLCRKPWMDRKYLAEFIKRVCKIKGWKHGSL